MLVFLYTNRMQTLVIGSTVVDVVLNIPSLPGRGEDVNITGAKYGLGGCAYNVFKTLTLFESPALLCSPVGSGVYGRMVREYLEKERIEPFVSLEKENGCCYCLVEPDGERTFLSHHGAEYLFSRSWMERVDFSKVSDIFICGLEVEEPTGNEIIDFVYEHNDNDVFFAPGPRITHIGGEKMERLLHPSPGKGRRGPILHLNETEALGFSGRPTIEEAAAFLASKTGNSVIITLGDRGCYCLSKSGGSFVPPFPAKVIDTVGAGDAHCGTIIACCKKGMSLEEACLLANKAGAAVVGVQGAALDRLPFEV